MSTHFWEAPILLLLLWLTSLPKPSVDRLIFILLGWFGFGFEPGKLPLTSKVIEATPVSSNESRVREASCTKDFDFGPSTTWLFLGTILHLCLLWFSGEFPLNC